jgi:hypothetical protein
MKKEYWFCRIGPVERETIPFGGDYPLRIAVEDTFEKMFPDVEYRCSTGWGLTPEMNDRMARISFLPILDTSGKILKEIDRMLEELTKELKENENNTN